MNKFFCKFTDLLSTLIYSLEAWNNKIIPLQIPAKTPPFWQSIFVMDFFFSVCSHVPFVALSNLISPWILQPWYSQHTIGWPYNGRALFTMNSVHTDQTHRVNRQWNTTQLEYTDSKYKGVIICTHLDTQISFKDNDFTLPCGMLCWCAPLLEV